MSVTTPKLIRGCQPISHTKKYDFSHTFSHQFFHSLVIILVSGADIATVNLDKET